MKTRILLLSGLCLILATSFFFYSQANTAKADVNIFASPIQGGCYIAASNDCRLHVDPFTINLASGEKLVYFRLISIEIGTGIQKTIYDFRPDQSNPVPFSGDTYTPSLVSQDYAATCGKVYQINLQGQDTGDTNPYSLGLTQNITCPSSVP
jgi:hypothetical protein